MSIQNTKRWFEQAVPAPTAKNLNVQTGCHFEEVREMADALTVECTNESDLHLWALFKHYAHEVAEGLKKGRLQIVAVDDKELLDAMCDQIVTGVGVGHMRNHNIVEALNEVNASNFSKFVDGAPIFDENGKIKKGPDFFKPNLLPFLPDTLNVL